VFVDPGTQHAVEAVFLKLYSPERLAGLKAAHARKLKSEKTARGERARAAAWAGIYKELNYGIEVKLTIPKNRLEALAEERALAVRRFLVGAERVHLLEPACMGGSQERLSRLSLRARRTSPHAARADPLNHPGSPS
jgi:hypothetical protein